MSNPIYLHANIINPIPPPTHYTIFAIVVVVQAGKDFTYVLVIIAGFVVAGFLFWSVGSEFFSQNSPSVVYSRALKRVKADPRVGFCHVLYTTKS